MIDGRKRKLGQSGGNRKSDRKLQKMVAQGVAAVAPVFCKKGYAVAREKGGLGFVIFAKFCV